MFDMGSSRGERVAAGSLAQVGLGGKGRHGILAQQGKLRPRMALVQRRYFSIIPPV
jgi:hypothetical protein